METDYSKVNVDAITRAKLDAVLKCMERGSECSIEWGKVMLESVIRLNHWEV